jgi:hypothetical protein
MSTGLIDAKPTLIADGKGTVDPSHGPRSSGICAGPWTPAPRHLCGGGCPGDQSRSEAHPGTKLVGAFSGRSHRLLDPAARRIRCEEAANDRSRCPAAGRRESCLA